MLFSIVNLTLSRQQRFGEQLKNLGPDFADVVCAASARKAKCELLSTRDAKGFRGSQLQIIDPLAAVAALRALE
jgi:predicted nucleic acid-binding protein